MHSSFVCTDLFHVLCSWSRARATIWTIHYLSELNELVFPNWQIYGAKLAQFAEGLSKLRRRGFLFLMPSVSGQNSSKKVSIGVGELNYKTMRVKFRSNLTRPKLDDRSFTGHAALFLEVWTLLLLLPSATTVCFYRRLSVHGGMGVSASVHAGIPLREQTHPPRSRHRPGADIPPGEDTPSRAAPGVDTPLGADTPWE